MNSKPRGEGSIDSNDISFGVVYDNGVRNRVNHAHPTLAGTMDLFKQAGVFEQAAKIDAQQRETLQDKSRDVRHILPDHQGGAEKLPLTDEGHRHLRGFARTVYLR